METYRYGIGQKEDVDFEVIVATHLAHPQTYVVYAETDGSHHTDTVVLWGVLQDGSPVPITMNGAWDGTINQNKFVMYPDGTCAAFERSWPDLDAALTEMAAQQPDDTQTIHGGAKSAVSRD